MQEFILALDQGTTSSRAMLFDRDLRPCATAQQEFPQIYPRPGWVEHDPEVLWQSQRSALLDVMKQAGCPPAAIAALAVTNQRETVVVWDRRTGKPIHNAIVWQCRRTAARCDELRKRGLADRIREKTGLVLDAYFSATKIEWILDHVDGARAAARRGDLLCGTVDTWLIWKLSGGRTHATDFSNASRTMLFDIHALRWDEELLDLFDIPAAMLPEVVPSSGIAAECALPEFGAHRPPVAGIAGDQQAALFGQGCFEPGQAKNTYGTGCFLLMNVGAEPILSTQGLLTTLNAQTRPGAPSYALEGSVFIGGAVHTTDYTNASRTLLYNIHDLRWDPELLALFDIPAAMLPAVVPSSGIAATCRLPEFGDRPPPIAGIAGDQQAALFGQGCFEPGQAKNTYGTGCFLLMNTGPVPVASRQGLLTTLTAQTRPGAPAYALEGSVFMGGAVMQWLRDELQILPRSSAAGPIAASVPDTGGVVLVPAFAGLGAPHWDMYARGALLGLTRGTRRAHIIRAAEEAIAYQCCDVVNAMQADSGRPIARLRVDGGAAADDFLMQFQADLLDCPIERPAGMESTALGAAALAALALGWQTPARLAARPPEKTFAPAMPAENRARLLAGWRKAISRAAHWEDPPPGRN